ncbi:MAG: hypothetical protein HY472_00860 [Candidatus Sungbacteria bacterium]|nr:hypothetical protein [Candidatus Sungbacteria bacterium]
MNGKRKKQIIHRFPWGQKENAQVLIVHLGSKSTPLIAQALREIGLTARIILLKDLAETLDAFFWNLVILAGSHKSVYESNAPHIPRPLIEQNTDRGTVFLGICYGGQEMVYQFGGTVAPAPFTEVGVADLILKQPWDGFMSGPFVMNHGDDIVVPPEGWERLGHTAQSANALLIDKSRRLITILGHPEMDDSVGGLKFFKLVAYRFARCTRDYTFDPERFVEEACAFIQKHVGSRSAIAGVSGGVDSSVALRLAQRALGTHRVQGVFVDTGFMRDGEMKEVRALLGTQGIRYVNARKKFYHAVEAIPYDPRREARYYDEIRKVMGECFIDVFVENVREYPNITHLVQGTNQADVIESETGLKRHHNVGGLPAWLKLVLVEPLAGLFKNEIRQIAQYLGLPQEIVWRQPFPGPGDALRSWGPMTAEKARFLGRANLILEEIVRKHYPDPHDRPNQYYISLAPLTTRGHVGDKGVNGYPVVVRAVASRERETYITMHPFSWSDEAKKEVTWRFTNELRFERKPIVRTWFDETGKPPATVEMH